MEITEQKPEKQSGNIIEGQVFWEEWIGKHHESSQSKKAFCRQNNLNYHRFQYWHHKFKRAKPESKRLIPVKTSAAAKPKPNPNPNPMPTPSGTISLSKDHVLKIYDSNLLLTILSSIL